MRSILTLGLCALLACGGRPDSTPKAPRVELLGAEALTQRVQQRNGRPLLLNFWAMW